MIMNQLKYSGHIVNKASSYIYNAYPEIKQLTTVKIYMLYEIKEFLRYLQQRKLKFGVQVLFK